MNFLPVSDVMLQRKWETQWGHWSSFGLLGATKSFQTTARAAGATARAAGATARVTAETFQTRTRAAEVFQTKISRNTSELEESGQHTRQDTNSLKLSNPKLFKIFQDYFSIYIYQNCQGRSQFLEVEVLHRQKEEQGDEPPVTSAINVSYIWYITLSLFTIKLLILIKSFSHSRAKKKCHILTIFPVLGNLTHM